MYAILFYDISSSDEKEKNNAARVRKAVEKFLPRVQFSVFECDIAPDQWVKLKAGLLDIFKPETDSLRFYHLGSKWRGKVEHHGAKPAVDVFKDTLII